MNASTDAGTDAVTGMGATGSTVDLREQALVVLDDEVINEGLADLRWQLRDLVLGGAQTIRVDLTHTSRMGSNALAALLSAHRACRARGGAVVLVNPNRQVTDMMRRTGLWRVFHTDPSGRSAGQLSR
jgi:anti-sigma B factor antagonist